MNSPIETRYLTRKEAAEYAHVSVSTIGRKIRSGELAAQRFGSGTKQYLTPEDLDACFRSTGATERERIIALAHQLATAAPKLSQERKAELAALLS